MSIKCNLIKPEGILASNLSCKVDDPSNSFYLQETDITTTKGELSFNYPDNTQFTLCEKFETSGLGTDINIGSGTGTNTGSGTGINTCSGYMFRHK